MNTPMIAPTIKFQALQPLHNANGPIPPTCYQQGIAEEIHEAIGNFAIVSEPKGRFMVVISGKHWNDYQQEVVKPSKESFPEFKSSNIEERKPISPERMQAFLKERKIKAQAFITAHENQIETSNPFVTSITEINEGSCSA